MPAVSQAQYRFMQAAKHNPAFAKQAGIKPEVAAEFVEGQKDYATLPGKKKSPFHRKIVRG